MRHLPHRRVLAVAVCAALAGCATGREARLRERLDAYRIERPLAQAWPAALKLLDERGFELTGDDPKLVGKPPQSAWSRIVSKGRETYELEPGHWVAETDVSRRNVRYRVDGWEADGGRSRIVYTAIQTDPMGSPNEDRPSRDAALELELVRRLEPARAAALDAP